MQVTRFYLYSFHSHMLYDLFKFNSKPVPPNSELETTSPLFYPSTLLNPNVKGKVLLVPDSTPLLDMKPSMVWMRVLVLIGVLEELETRGL